jgi:hypothetical protein
VIFAMRELLTALHLVLAEHDEVHAAETDDPPPA